MNIAVITVVVLLSILSANEVAGAEQNVRVRLQHGQETIAVSALGLQIGRLTGVVDATLTTGLERAKIRRLPSGVWLVKRGSARTWEPVKSETLAIRGQMVRLGVTPAPQNLELYANAKHGIDVISRMELETYLSGVLPSEMPATWPLEALKAQAVAARSFVMRTAFERRGKHFDVDSSISDQVYKFVTDVKDHPELADKIRRAIGETRGELLLDLRHRILKAFYSADCGCQSEDPKFVWGTVDDFESVKDPSCGVQKTSTWKLSLERREVREKLVTAFGLPSGAGLRTINVGGRTPSGRVAAVVALLDVDGRARNIHIKSQEFRRIFGFERVRSTDFSLRWMADSLEVSGRGAGHGVGLCQRGAQALAIQGLDYRAILRLYYPKAKLVSPKSV